ncbi:MAG: methyltransferase domain-containing protein [Oligoflexia bacterium]|nr:methyltransferase domain-containing protein [Oligoflexia bacterium]
MKKLSKVHTKTRKNHYLHGYTTKEQARLREQARFLEFLTHQDINFSNTKNILEVGCGVGAQSEILLRRFPEAHLTCIDLNPHQIASAREHLKKFAHYQGRYTIKEMNACDLSLESKSFDGAFLCWVLEHIERPEQVLNEVRRVLRSGARIYVTEVMNFSFFLEPYSPNLWKYWMAFNDYQYEQAGDPFVGAKLGNLLTKVGFSNVHTNVRTMHYDNRWPELRREVIEYWTKLMLSAAKQLITAKATSKEIVSAALAELQQVRKDPNAVFFYSFMQAHADVL